MLGLHPVFDASPGVFAAALLIDLALGELPSAFHPVVWMGKVTAIARRHAPPGRRAGLAAGLFLAAGLPLLFASGAALLLCALPAESLVGAASGALVLTTTFSVRLLDEEAAGLEAPLRSGDLGAARGRLHRLCSRDATELDEGQVAGAGISSLVENTNDSIVAPWFWYALFGIPGAMAFRAVNTLDAMVGYRGRYEWFGKASARLDDAAGFIPARITGVLLVAAAALRGHSARGAWACIQRDAHRTPSPNGGWPMAATAGAMGIRLEKPGAYVLGEGGRVPSPDDVGVARGMVRTTTGLSAAALLGAILLPAALRAVA